MTTPDIAGLCERLRTPILLGAGGSVSSLSSLNRPQSASKPPTPLNAKPLR